MAIPGIEIPDWLRDEITLENAIGAVAGLILVAIMILNVLGYAK